jgi:hypothetical protein
LRFGWVSRFSGILVVFRGFPAGCPTSLGPFSSLWFCGGVSVDRDLPVTGCPCQPGAVSPSVGLGNHRFRDSTYLGRPRPLDILTCSFVSLCCPIVVVGFSAAFWVCGLTGESGARNIRCSRGGVPLGGFCPPDPAAGGDPPRGPVAPSAGDCHAPCLALPRSPLGPVALPCLSWGLLAPRCSGPWRPAASPAPPLPCGFAHESSISVRSHFGSIS